jgi:hypothetical protein
MEPVPEYVRQMMRLGEEIARQHKETLAALGGANADALRVLRSLPTPPQMPEMAEMPEISRPIETKLRLHDAQLASGFAERLLEHINDFNESLDEEHEVGARLVSFGERVAIYLDGIGYWNPSLILFSGRNGNGDPVELIQHISQTSVLLVKLPRLDPDQPKRRIGFVQEDGIGGE